jgi:hypothetical protein
LAGYLEDANNNNPDLTESSTDSSYVTIEEIDSMGQLITRDSLVVKTIFHNDRTEKQANTIIEQLVALGVDRKKITITTEAKPEDSTENRKMLITLIAK